MPQGEPGATILGGAVRNNITVQGDYLRIRNFIFEQTDHNSVEIRNHHHIFIEDTVSLSVARSEMAEFGDAGISFNGNNIYMLRNTIHTLAIAGPLEETGLKGLVSGIIGGGHTVIATDNRITGRFIDGITAGADYSRDGGWGENSDVARNYIERTDADLNGDGIPDIGDDAMQAEGGNLNIRVWGNIMPESRGGIGLNDSVVGPLYVFRNVFGDAPLGATKGGNADGPIYFFHNTIDNTVAEGIDNAGRMSFYFNNIIKVKKYSINWGHYTNQFDYNLHHFTEDRLITFWVYNGTPPNGCGIDFTALSAWKNCTGQGTHSIEALPLFSNAGKELDPSSPGVDAGVILANFNDQNSAWPFADSAPDIGAFEYRYSATDNEAPSVPTNLTAIPVSSSQINLAWTASTDDVGVTNYKIYRNSQLINSSNSLTYSDTGLSANTVYSYAISAIDAANNESAKSTEVSATTLSASDLNQDGKVDSTDFNTLKLDWNKTAKPSSDLNQDGIVDTRDLGIMMGEWGG